MSAVAAAKALETRLGGDDTAIVPYLTGGYPSSSTFSDALLALSRMSIAVEIGIPFSDPMADGATIQESSRVALEKGATLHTILDAIEGLGPLDSDLVVMSYLNPLLAYGYVSLLPRLAAVGVSALVVPDLPLEESDELASVSREHGIGLVQLVSPVTSAERLDALGHASEGFTYAVTMTGTTGGTVGASPEVTAYLDRVRKASRPPVLAGFGVRTAEQIRALAPHCDGMIVGSALVEIMASGGDPVAFVAELRR
ncbi:MAG TPA: tryptophan synthase subunit alpha [Acidimicrobiia bacterium]|jgi:tryptophan synthase alpha chain|nr:tryptophan synthase subunit alpha [Acidimicrobiia bacterium]